MISFQAAKYPYEQTVIKTRSGSMPKTKDCFGLSLLVFRFWYYGHSFRDTENNDHNPGVLCLLVDF